MRNPVTTTKRKFDGSAKSPWHGDLVEAGPDGWLVVYYEHPPHAVASEPVVHALRYFSLELPLSILASFDSVGSLLEFQCDAGLPATIRGREIDFVDLDLDLIVAPDGGAAERDHDTFARNRERMGYSTAAVDAARHGLRLARELHAARATPFDGSAARLLGRVLAASGPV